MSIAGDGREPLPHGTDPEEHNSSKGSTSPERDPLTSLMEIRGFLMVFATVMASVTYRAGLNPPGGFWADNIDGHKAGTSVFQDVFCTRNKIFHYFNTSSFMMSLFILLLAIKASINNSDVTKIMLHLAVLIDVITLIGAYIVGAYEDFQSSTYAVLLMLIVFIYLVFEVTTLIVRLCKIIRQMAYMLAKI
ncbi:hypothetical protein LUZ63_008557 [Rhynchospora breviuscula]|uniref:PGG domain-containing protein n=1 Tax=Rhynchospora breviuscula TaxID=2022672 RepID=A0A9Q0CTV6_9POAL|nr:hypothetical protein LUZ63_008557 [Rhynchospora breviuscula]